LWGFFQLGRVHLAQDAETDSCECHNKKFLKMLGILLLVEILLASLLREITYNLELDGKIYAKTEV
jgi:hypothetical protein